MITWKEIRIETISKVWGVNGSPGSIVSRWFIVTHMDLQQKETTHPKSKKKKHGTGRFTYIHVPYKLSQRWVNKPITWISKQPCFISSLVTWNLLRTNHYFQLHSVRRPTCCPPRTKCMAGICASGFTRWTCKNAHGPARYQRIPEGWIVYS